MAKTIKTRISLDGESKYKKQLKEINTQLKSLSSQMRLATSTFNKNNTSILGNLKHVKSLKEQQKLLTEQIAAQKDKVNTLKNALKESNEKYSDAKQKLKECTEKYGENSEEAETARKAVEKYGKQVEDNTNALNDETANLNNLNNQFQDNRQEINQLDPKMVALKASVEGLETVFVALSKVSLKAVSKGVEDIGKAVATISVASIKAVTNVVKDSTEAFELYSGAITGSLTSIGQFSVSTGSTFEKSMSNIQATLGYVDYTDEQMADMEAMEDLFKSIASTTSFSANEIASGAQKMALAGWDTEAIMAGISPFLDATAASGEDLVTVFDVLTDAITACGYSADDAQQWADVLSATVTSSNTTIAELGGAFKYIGSMSDSLDYSLEDLSLGLGLLANAGIKAESAGNALKSGLTAMLNPTEDAQKAMEKYGLSLTDTEGNILDFSDVVQEIRTVFGDVSDELVDADGNLLEYEDLEEKLSGDAAKMQKLADASEIFGRRQIAAWLAIANSTDADYEKLESAIENSDGMASKMADVQLDNLSGSISLLKSAVEAVGLSIYDYIESPLRTLVETASTLFSKLVVDIDGGFNFEAINQHITTFKNAVVSQFNALFPEILQGLAGCSSTFNTVFYDLFSGMIDTAPKAIGQGGTVLVQSFWQLINDMITKVDSSQDTLLSTAEKFVTTFANGLVFASKNLKNTLPNMIKNISKSIKNVLPTVLNMGKEILSTIVTGIISATPEFLSVGADILNYLSESLQDSPDFVTDLLESIHDALVTSVPNVLTAISTLVSTIFDSLSTDEVTMKIVGLIRMVSDDLKDALTTLIPEIVAFFPTFLDQIFQPLVNAILDPNIINMLVDGVVQMATDLINFIANNTERLVDVVLQGVTALVDSLTENADTILPALAKFVEGVLVGIANNISDLLDALLNLVEEIIVVLLSPDVLNPLLEGITTLVSKLLFALVDNLPTLVKIIADTVLAFLDIISDPEILSQLVETACELVGDIFLGATSLMPSIASSIATFVKSLYDAIKSSIFDQDLGSIGNQLIQGIVDGFSNAWDYASEAIDNIADRFLDNFKSVFGINSPSKLMKDEVGKYVALGLADGITDEVDSLSTAVSDTVNAMTSSIDTTSIEIPTNVVVDVQQGLDINETIDGMVSDVEATAVEIPTSLVTKVQGDLDVGKTIGDSLTSYDWVSIGKSILDGLVDGITGEVSTLATAINDAIGTLIDNVDTTGIEVPAKLATATQDDLEVAPSGKRGTSVNENSTQNNSSTQQSIVNFDGLFNGANVTIASDYDVETIAEKLYYYMQQQNMGVGIL